MEGNMATEYENLLSTYATLEAQAAPHASSSVSVHRHDDGLSTESSAGQSAEGSADNPRPVSGYADSNELLATPSSDVAPTMQEDGRYSTEVIIGTDDRVRVNNPDTWPWRVQGHMEMTFPNGRRYIGSGTMVNKHHVLTAGHCVYSSADGGWATSVIFEAARNDGSIPHGSIPARTLLSVQGWTNNNDSNYDMGMLILTQDLGVRTGWMGVVTGPDSMLANYRVNVSGYPGDKGGRQLWTMADVIKSVSAERIMYHIDTMGGQSGSGVWSTWAGHVGEKVCAIHTTGSTTGNGGTRISRPKFDRIIDWMASH
jgi:glutamyl endopeptidase